MNLQSPPPLEIDYHGYRLINVYQRITPEQCEEVIRFWQKNNAISDLDELQRRTSQVVFMVRDPQEQVCGISTVYIQNLTPGNPYYFYRMFIQPMDRISGMMRVITESTRHYLHHATLPNKPLGMIIVTENQKLMREGMKRMFTRHNYEYMGLSPKGLDMWRVNF